MTELSGFNSQTCPHCASSNSPITVQGSLHGPGSHHHLHSVFSLVSYGSLYFPVTLHPLGPWIVLCPHISYRS